MSRRVHVSPVVCLLLLVVPSWSQLGSTARPWADVIGPPPEKPFLVGIGPVTVQADDEVSGVCAIGPVTIGGKVYGDVTSIGGKVTLIPGALVAGTVTAVCAELDVPEGATIAGEVHANELPDLAEVRLGSTPQSKARLFVGGTELTDENLSDVLVLGGDVFVRPGATVGSLGVVGGNANVAAGAEVYNLRVVGGTITRQGDDAKQPHADRAIATHVMRCGGAPPREGAAAVWVSPRVNYSDHAVRPSMDTTSPYRAAVNVSVLSQLHADLRLSVRVVQRRPESERPKPAEGDQPQHGYGSGYGGRGGQAPWPGEALYISAEADPLFQTSTALGTSLTIATRVRLPAAGAQKNADEKTITIAVPADAAGPDMSHGLGGGFGGGLGGFGQY